MFVRSDKSGTSGVFTDYLAKAAPADWTKGKTETFPTDKGQIGKAGSDGVSNAVKAAAGGIGYAEHSFAVERQLGEVQVKNGAGEFKGPDTAAVTAAIDAATHQPRRHPDAQLHDRPSPACTPSRRPATCWCRRRWTPDKGDNLIAFLNYVLGDGQGKAAALELRPGAGRAFARPGRRR